MAGLEEEVDFEDYCPWLEERRVEFREEEEESEDGLVPGEWVVLDEVEEEEDERVVVEKEEEDSMVVEEVLEDDTQDKRKKTRLMECPVCCESVRHLARHSLDRHLPWFWAPLTCCIDCREQFVNAKVLQFHRSSQHPDQQQSWNSSELSSLIKGLLDMLLHFFNISALDELLQLLDSDGDIKRICTKKLLTNPDLELCRALDTSSPFNTIQAFTILDLNNNFSLFSLAHWRVILHLVSKLSTEQQQQIRNYNQLSSSSPVKSDSCVPPSPSEVSTPDSSSSKPVQIIDSHLHLDHLLPSVGVPDLQELDLLHLGSQFSSELSYIISNYCFPNFWPKREDRHQLINKIPSLRFSFGIHPKTVQTTTEEILDEYLDTLEELIKTEHTVSIGECGLDTSNTSKPLHLRRQTIYFEKQLELAVFKDLPVVVHCRGNTSVHFEALDSLIKICPPNHPIHWHCFSGIQPVYNQATSYFSNIVFGITPFIVYKPDIQNFVRRNSTTNLVLETDSPFIYYNNRPGTPFHINYVAQHVSQTLDLPFIEVVSTTTENVKRIYHL